MNNEAKLKKVSDRLYVKPCKGKDGKDFEVEWKKELEMMWLDLTNVSLRHTLSIENPVFAVGRDRKRDGDVNRPKLPYDEYVKEEHRSISATGLLDKKPDSLRSDTISLIMADGAIERGTYSEVKNVNIFPLESDLTQEDVEMGRANGSLGHWIEDGEFYLDLGIPADTFDCAYRELQEPKGKAVVLCVYVDAFNTDIDRAFRPPDMAKTFYIEANSSSRAYFKTLMISEPVRTILKNSHPNQGNTEEEKAVRSEPKRSQLIEEGGYNWMAFLWKILRGR